MSASEPDTPEQADPAADPPTRPLLSAGFWIAMSVSLLAILAGLGVALFGARF